MVKAKTRFQCQTVQEHVQGKALCKGLVM